MDPFKARRTLARQGVDFDVAKDVFLDHAGVTDRDDSESEEERWRVIGLAGGRLLFVVFTEPDDDVIRIIPAREAGKREERLSYGQTSP